MFRSGTTYGITNGFGNLSGFGVPYVVAAITAGHEHSAMAWRWVFFIAAGFYVLATVFFVFAASGKVQDFNTKSYEKFSFSQCCKNRQD